MGKEARISAGESWRLIRASFDEKEGLNDEFKG